MWIIKLGGSLLSSGSLKEWLSIITELGAGKLVIVPGGGFFADHVRDAQKKLKFDDKIAHQMALLAMEQYALLLKSHASVLDFSDSIEGIEKAVNQNQIPVWLPFRMSTQCQDLSSNWKLTSDSLALWLASQLNAEHTLLVKSLSASGMNSRQLSELGMVDENFPEFVNKLDSGLWWLDQNDMNELKKLLKKNEKPEDYLKPIAY